MNHQLVKPLSSFLQNGNLRKGVKINSLLCRLQFNKSYQFLETESKKSKVFIEEVYSLPPKINYETKKTRVKSRDGCWTSDFLDIKKICFGSDRYFEQVCLESSY